MPDQTIYIIRHAEKPEPEAPGVDESVNLDKHSLLPLGWQRAGAWAWLWIPSLGSPTLLRPSAIYASAPATKHEDTSQDPGAKKSRRPLETVTPLARKVLANGERDINLTFSHGQEADLAEQFSKLAGVTLVCWQHETIKDILASLDEPPADIPQNWPSDCFNVIYKLTRPDEGTAWTLEQIAPLMLQGDRPDKLT
jgi:hypothetical protein